MQMVVCRHHWLWNLQVLEDVTHRRLERINVLIYILYNSIWSIVSKAFKKNSMPTKVFRSREVYASQGWQIERFTDSICVNIFCMLEFYSTLAQTTWSDWMSFTLVKWQPLLKLLKPLYSEWRIYNLHCDNHSSVSIHMPTILHMHVLPSDPSASSHFSPQCLLHLVVTTWVFWWPLLALFTTATHPLFIFLGVNTFSGFYEKKSV